MIEIKIIRKKDILDLLSDKSFWNHSFLSISKHRLYAHYKNPNLDENDIVLLLSYLNQELVGYMGLFIDKVTVGNSPQKIGWLSTWWVHPKTKGTGVGRELLNTMYAENKGFIGISQFTPSAKRVYDKSGYFTDLKKSKGCKAVLRSNLSFVLPAIAPATKKATSILNTVDHFLNFFINFKIKIQKKMLFKNVKGVSIEYLNTMDTETHDFITQFNQNDFSTKTDSFFEWLKAYNWVQKAPLLALTQNQNYEFSMYDKDFEISFLKIIKNNLCIGFVVLQKRNYVSKVLFSYFAAENTNVVAAVIKLQAMTQNTREIICYDEHLCENFKKSFVFLYKTKKVKHSIISKAFGVTNFESVKLHFGDGDCSFA